MHTYTVTIGRHVGTEPMPEHEWAMFEDRINETLCYFGGEQHREGGDPSMIETHRGTGVWDGVEEESIKMTLLTTTPIRPLNLEVLRKDLGQIAYHHRQDAIALTIGTSELIGAGVNA